MPGKRTKSSDTPLPVVPSGETIHKEFKIEITEKRENGGRIRINTGALDRQSDRVFPNGGNLADYQKNPVVQWAHNYRDPFATIGRSVTLTQSNEALDVEFELRPAANEFDPQNIVLLLWNGGWINTSS